MSEEMLPDERALRAELCSARFVREIDFRWGDPTVTGSTAVVAIRARDIDGQPREYHVKFDCAGYPQKAPTATFWDIQTNSQLTQDKRPWGTGHLNLVFRFDWEAGSAFYHPCDRKALDTHSDWPTKCPSACWTPDKGLTHYVNEIYTLLNSELYQGTFGSLPRTGN